MDGEMAEAYRNEFKSAQSETAPARARAVKAVAMLRAGLPAPAVAKAVGVSVRQVYRYWRAYLGKSIWGKRADKQLALDLEGRP